MAKLIMQKRLSDGSDVEFHKQTNGFFKYMVLGNGIPAVSRNFDKLIDAVEDFRTRHRDHTNDALRDEEQAIVDQFNSWDGNLQEMGFFE
ncbi:hypothetical protein HB904_09345 [Listeria booriae]|uniref:Uncharacterized protein n=1 Tax=Listeria booriae TaxID=1552123 RepID=A0A842AES7_9LIST|nr:hypothetical protein [Listeria booriae]MBC1616393.1 hypothetical protein [Listeria booriae]